MKDLYNKPAFEYRFDSDALKLQKALLNERRFRKNRSRIEDRIVLVFCIIFVATIIGGIFYGW